jgi:alpha-beta hydrolase superfamily lysophospholipase
MRARTLRREHAGNGAALEPARRMHSHRFRIVLVALLVGQGLGLCVWTWMTPVWWKNRLLHPPRRSAADPVLAHEDLTLDGDGLTLRGWRFPAHGAPRGTLVYLHGFGDDRHAGEGIARRFAPLGFEVLAYESRAHGASDGAVCTYGVAEKRDLARILDARPLAQRALPVVLLGGSLGGAVALQAAATDARIALVVAIAPYAELRTLALERAPCFVREAQIEAALELAEREGGFAIDAAAPLALAPAIRCPVLLVHGEQDRLTLPSHSQRIHAALACEKELILVPGVDHGDPVGDAAWQRIEAAVRRVVEPASARGPVAGS